MSEESFQDKTEPATPKKKEDARKKGDVAKSRELPSVAILIASTIYLFFGAKHLTMTLGNNIKATFLLVPSLASGDNFYLPLLAHTIKYFLLILMPIMIILCVAAIFANIIQSGFLLSVEPLTPKLSKIDPISGLTKIISKKSLVELAKSVLKISIVGWAVISTLENDMSQLIPLMYKENVQIFSFLGEISMKVVARCCCVILVLAILDYIYQKWDHEENLKMTKQEVKDEFRQTEGDPMVKSRIKSIQRDMARRRMMAEVPKADVIITNPTHLSIALKYRPDEGMRAPAIVAKGANNIAFRIREIASEHNIPIMENKPLAQNLYKLDIGDEIPPQFYQAVAEILAYVYGLKKERVKNT